MLTNGTVPEETTFSGVLDNCLKLEEEGKYREDEQKCFFINFSATNIMGTKESKQENLDSCINLPFTMMNREP